MIRFINHTTSLPVNGELERYMAAILTNELSAVLATDMQFHHEIESSIDVFFVSALDLYDGFDKKPDLGDRDHADTLGVYYPCHTKYGRTIIQISPEKIMDTAIRLKKRPEARLPLTDIYPALTIGVVIHEIAHWLMDERQRERSHRAPWKWLANRYGDDPGYAEDYIQGLLKQPFPESYCERDSQYQGERKFIEESLANAIMLIQNWSDPVLQILKLFVQNSPSEYAAGLNWQLSRGELIASSEGWREHKGELRYKKWFGTLLPIAGSPIGSLSSSLSGSKDITSSVEFKCTFLKFVEESLSDMKAAWENDRAKYDNMLNGTFGVFDWLCTQAWWKKCNLGAEKLASLLNEWSEMGATGKIKSEEFRGLHGF